MKDCPEGNLDCPCAEYSKDGLCDWPYRNGMSYQEARYMTELLQVVEESEYEQREIERQGKKRRS